MKERLEGIVTPVVTMLQDNGQLDRDGVIRHQNFLIDRGIAGIFVLGTTGEGPALPDFVRKDMIETSRCAVNGRVPLLVGVSSAGLEDSLELARFAANHGADAIVSAPLCYLPGDDAELLEYFRILSREQPLPIFIYNMPAMTKIDMAPELLLKIAELPGVIGYKDSAGNFAAFEKVVSVLKNRKDFSVLMGPDTLLGKAVAAGACGGVNSGSNVAPEFYVNLRKAILAGNSEEAAKWQREIEALQSIYQFRENICCGVAAGLKKALSLLGFCGTAMTRPARAMEDHDEITQFIRHYREICPLAIR
ncbi:MAG: dihydrodipicolinate synthase family protein [Victivallaceae bacterium]|nr:dihydrodipicolinate synthase family protein [Victivallaceae bacterium]